MNKSGYFSKKGKFLRESLLLIVILSLFLVFVVAQGDDFGSGQPDDIPVDPWSAENFEQSFRDNPLKGFEHDPAKAIEIMNGDTSLFNNPALLQKFDSHVINKVAVLNNNPAAKEMWLKTKFSIGMASNDIQIKSYDGTNIVTENANFDPETLPKTGGVSYELTSDGLDATGKYAGKYSGKITYNKETDTLNCDTGFVDAKNTKFGCSEALCSIQVGADGTVKLLQGKGNVNGISAANLRDVFMTNGIINALPNQEGSFIDGTEMFSENTVSYDPKENTFYNVNNLQVKSTSAEKLFRGIYVDFMDKNNGVVATLTSGETRFVLGTGKCLPGSCISVNPETSTITTSIAENSIVTIHSDGYRNLDFKEIKDGSQVFVEESGSRIVSVDNNGMHPYQDLTGLGKRMSYEIETAGGSIAKHINNNGIDEVCVGEECTVCTLMQCVA